MDIIRFRRKFLRVRLWGVAVVVGGLSACAGVERAAPPVGPELREAAAARRVDPAALARGRRIYRSGKCIGCHAVEPIGRYSKAQWPDILSDMAGEADLSSAEADDLEAYVMTARRMLDRRR